MLPQLEALLQASTAVLSFDLVDNDPIDDANFLFKLRCALRSGRTLQILRYRARASRSTFHWMSRRREVSPCF